MGPDSEELSLDALLLRSVPWIALGLIGAGAFIAFIVVVLGEFPWDDEYGFYLFATALIAFGIPGYGIGSMLRGD